MDRERLAGNTWATWRCIVRHGLAVALLAMTGATARGTNELYSLDELYEMGAEWVKDVTPPTVWEEYEIIGLDEWRNMLADLQIALNGDSYDTPAAWLPYARDTLEALRALPGAEPYVAWLAQRLDFFEVADTVVRLTPVGAPPVVAPPPRHPPASPPPRPAIRVAPPPPAGVRKKRNEAAHDVSAWITRIQAKPLPPKAVEWAPVLKGIFREEGVPEALIWIAEVESSFNPRARSPVGAVGLFQFMPSTAESLGLSLRPTDQRLDPHHSARGAARYLRILYERFGDWPLVLAAYNAGEGRVGRLLKVRAARSFAAIEDDLPVETRMYVPKVKATIMVREGLNVETLPPPFHRATSETINRMFAQVE